MKKIIIILSILSIVYITNNKEKLIIPKESIRFRIIANSNTIKDQALKLNIKDDLIKEIIPKINANSINESRKKIKENIPLIETKLNEYNIPYKINYGNNYFPTKTYKGVEYKEGNYESLVITLGDGLGENYWCVLYPPLCLVEQQNNINEIEYKSIINEILNNN